MDNHNNCSSTNRHGQRQVGAEVRRDNGDEFVGRNISESGFQIDPALTNQIQGFDERNFVVIGAIKLG